MKIKFDVDKTKKEIIFFFKNGDMELLARELVNRFPDKKTEELSHIGSQHLAEPIFKFLNLIEEKMRVPVTTYNVRFVCYQRNMELPKDLKKM